MCRRALSFILLFHFKSIIGSFARMLQQSIASDLALCAAFLFDLMSLVSSRGLVMDETAELNGSVLFDNLPRCRTMLHFKGYGALEPLGERKVSGDVAGALCIRFSQRFEVYGTRLTFISLDSFVLLTQWVVFGGEYALDGPLP